MCLLIFFEVFVQVVIMFTLPAWMLWWDLVWFGLAWFLYIPSQTLWVHTKCMNLICEKCSSLWSMGDKCRIKRIKKAQKNASRRPLFPGKARKSLFLRSLKKKLVDNVILAQCDLNLISLSFQSVTSSYMYSDYMYPLLPSPIFLLPSMNHFSSQQGSLFSFLKIFFIL